MYISFNQHFSLLYKLFKTVKGVQQQSSFSWPFVVFILLPVLLLPIHHSRSSLLAPGVPLRVLNMASQRDMFADSPGSSQSAVRLSSSLPSAVTYEYLWIILFEWNLDLEHPFALHQIGTFSHSELKDEWIKGDLDELSRLKKLTFGGFKGKTFSLFAKVEKCKCNIIFIKNCI